MTPKKATYDVAGGMSSPRSFGSGGVFIAKTQKNENTKGPFSTALLFIFLRFRAFAIQWGGGGAFGNLGQLFKFFGEKKRRASGETFFV